MHDKGPRSRPCSPLLYGRSITRSAMATLGRAGPEIRTLPAAAGQPRLAVPSSHRDFESHSVSSSYRFLLIHAPEPRPPRCPHILCQLSNQVGLFSIPAGQGIQGGQSAMARRQVQRYVASCLSQSRTKISSTFCSQVCLFFGCRHRIFCNRPSNFVRLSE